MKKLIPLLFVFVFAFVGCTETPIHEQRSQNFQPTENLLIITLDGVAWDDVFGDADVLDRNFLAQRGNLYGDRNKGNKVDVLNPSAKSYPGYAEMFTGNITDITDNTEREARNKTVFEFFNDQPEYDWHRVQSWSLSEFSYYLFRPSISTLPVLNHQFITFENEKYISEWVLDNLDDPDLNRMYNVKGNFLEVKLEMLLMQGIHRFGDDDELLGNNEKAEQFLYLAARKTMQKLHPKAMHIGFVLTDHFAHLGQREEYLSAARNVGIYIKDLIAYIDSDPFYRNNTSIVITTDHGRSSNFRDHGRESFLIILNPSLTDGIVDREEQIYNAQIAQTLANLIGLEYTAEHEISEAIEL